MVHKASKRHSGCHLNDLSMLSLRPVFTGNVLVFAFNKKVKKIMTDFDFNFILVKAFVDKSLFISFHLRERLLI